MMNPEIKAKWLTALRSGEYKQGKCQLVSIDSQGEKSYCCLGVLCDIQEKDGYPGLRFNGSGWSFDGEFEMSVLPFDLAIAIGLNDPDPVVRVPQGLYFYSWATLSEFNDKGFSFREIADIIEEQL